MYEPRANTSLQGKPLQTGFQAGMEHILGVQDNKKPVTGSLASLSEDTILADAQYDTEGNEMARARYQRHFWEPVAEGRVCLSALSECPIIHGPTEPRHSSCA